VKQLDPTLLAIINATRDGRPQVENLNIVLQTDGFDQLPAWNAAATGNSTPNAGVSPSGNNDAYSILSGTGTTQSVGQTLPVYTGQAETASIYAKQGTSALFSFGLFDSVASAFLNLATINWTAGVPSLASGSCTITPDPGGNGWYRFSFSVAGPAGHGGVFFVFPESTTGASCAAKTTLFYGANVTTTPNLLDYQPSGAQLEATVDNPNAQLCDFDCYTLTLTNGTVLRFTTADFDISDGTNTWRHDLVGVDEASSRVVAHWKAGFDVDTWVVVFMPRPLDVMTGALFPDTIAGVPWLQACQGGALDGAELVVDRAYFSDLPTWPMPPTGAIPVGFAPAIFAGLVGVVDTNAIVAVLTASDYRVILDTQVPIHVFTGGCRYTLFDVGCTLNASDFDTTGVAIGGSTQGSIANMLPAPAGSGTYLQGRITMTSGPNAGFSRMITGWNGPGQPFALFLPFPFPITSGDTFIAYPGCAKTQAACTAFGNLLNFGGESYLPAPEAAV